jgi:hypothetical protein
MGPAARTWDSPAPPASVDAMLRTAEIFAALGERDAVAQCIRLAERLAAARCDPAGLERVYAFTRSAAVHPWSPELASA